MFWNYCQDTLDKTGSLLICLLTPLASQRVPEQGERPAQLSCLFFFSTLCLSPPSIHFSPWSSLHPKSRSFIGPPISLKWWRSQLRCTNTTELVRILSDWTAITVGIVPKCSAEKPHHCEFIHSLAPCYLFEMAKYTIKQAYLLILD